MAAGPGGRLASRHHRRHGGGRQPYAGGFRPRDRRARVGAAGRRRAERPVDRADRPVRHGGLPPHALFREKAAGSSRCRAIFAR